MSDQNINRFARRLHSLERRHDALARARQLPASSLLLPNGDSIPLGQAVESANDAATGLDSLDSQFTDLGGIADSEAINSSIAPEWIPDAGEGFDAGSIAYERARTAKAEADAAVLEAQTALAEAQTALADAGLARSEAAQAVSDAAAALAEAEQAILDSSAATSAAAAAQSTANAAQTAAGTAQGAADDAAAAALAASGAAAAAQSTANSKGKTIIQSAAPAVADRLAQNLWIDTTGGANTPKRWDGSAWVAVTDKAATDAANAAVAAQNRADDAFDEAVAASTAAGNAQTAANGKNRVWYQGTAPTGTAHRVDDVWFDTSQGNRMARWNGTTWAVVEFGGAALANNAVSTAKLADDAVTSAKIALEAVGNDELAAVVKGAITTAQSTATAAQGTANTAQSNANQALADAATAAGIAGGKADVLIQSTAPAAAMRKATTLWIDTTGGANTPKRWTTGTTWVAVTDKVATDAAANAATAQSIASGAASAAAAAQSAANAAQLAADAAQSTANGRAVVVRSTSAATAAGSYKLGDQWWQFSGANITGLWLHDGTAWVSQALTNAIIATLDAGKITTGYLAAARIQAATITGTHIAGTTITAANMVAGTITAASGIIADAAIGSAKIINLAVTGAKIADATIQSAKIANLDAGKITTGTLDAARIAALSITTDKIAALAVTANEIAAGAIVAAKIAANAVTAEKINAGAVTTDKLDALAVTATKIAAGAIVAEKIAAGAITTSKLAADAIDGMTITGAEIIGGRFYLNGSSQTVPTYSNTCESTNQFSWGDGAILSLSTTRRSGAYSVQLNNGTLGIGINITYLSLPAVWNVSIWVRSSVATTVTVDQMRAVWYGTPHDPKTYSVPANTWTNLVYTSSLGDDLAGIWIKGTATAALLIDDISSTVTYDGSASNVTIGRDLYGSAMIEVMRREGANVVEQALLKEGRLTFQNPSSATAMQTRYTLLGIESIDSVSKFTIAKRSSAMGTGIDLVAGNSPSNTAAVQISGADGGRVSVYGETFEVNDRPIGKRITPTDFFGAGTGFVIDEATDVYQIGALVTGNIVLGKTVGGFISNLWLGNVAPQYIPRPGTGQPLPLVLLFSEGGTSGTGFGQITRSDRAIRCWTVSPGNGKVTIPFQWTIA